MISTEVLIGVGLAIVAGAILFIILWLDRRTPPTQSITDSTELQIWTERARRANEDFGLAATRGVGEKWAASIAALLGVLSAVAFVAGPSALVEDVGGQAAAWAAALVLAAAVCAAAATLLAALAEHGTPVFKDNMTGHDYRTLTRVRAKRSAWEILASRILVVITLLLMIAATTIAWTSALTAADEKPGQSALVNGPTSVTCGKIAALNGAVGLKVGEAVAPIPPEATITLVSSCPE